MKQKIIILLLLLTNFLFAQDQLEIPFDYKNNLINIKVEVGGKKENFIFDTGAMNVLTREFAESQNLTLKKSKARGYIGKTEAFETTLSQFSPFGKDLQNVKFRVIDWDFVNKLNVKGLIGPEIVRMLGYNILTIDYQNQKLIFGNQKLEKYDFAFDMYKMGNPRIWLGKTNFKIDTGNPLFGESNSKKFSTNQECDNFSSYSLSFSNQNMQLCKNSIKDLNGKTFVFKQFLFERAPKNIIGNLALQNYLVQIDFENRKLFFTKNEFYPMPNDIYFIEDEKGYFVSLINEKSDIYKKGVQVGEYLEKIDGFDLGKKKSVAELHRFILNNEKVNLIIKKNYNSLLKLNDLKIN